FRHLPHTASKDCPLYHLPYGHDISNVFQHRAFRPRQPKLFLRLSGRGNPQQWELILLVPRIDEFFEFVIDKSPNRGRIQMRAVSDRGRECPVYPDRDDYQLALFNRKGEVEVEVVDGLGSLGLFRLAADLGSRVESTESLLAGSAYVAIYQA